MGSRVMHYIISHKIAAQINVENQAEFILGGIAPDASSNKEQSHFFEGVHEEYTRAVSFEKFNEKYKHHENRSYILGYYAHLIADHIWLTGFFMPWLRNRMENDANIHKEYHHDFSLLNKKLVDYYEIPIADLKEVEQTQIPNIDEVQADDVKRLFLHLEDDLHSTEDGQLKVFSFEQIIGYVETSIQICLQKLSAN